MKRVMALTAALILAASASGDILELKYDNGMRALQLAWYTGAGRWVGNDFNLSTLKTKNNVVRHLKFYTSPYWPDDDYDGFRLALYAYSGGVPGSRLWPKNTKGYFVKPAGGEGFKTFWVNYYLDTNRFVAAVEQFYDYPNCDPYFCDSNPTFQKRSWQKRDGAAWKKLVGLEPYPYRNLMLRVSVFVNYAEVGLAPTSLGRVKALYY